MAYNYFPAGYQPANYQPSYQNGATSNLIWVQGEESAKSYLVAPNTTVVLWDSEKNTVYIKSADASGMPSLKILDYVMREDALRSPEISDISGFATKEDISLIREEIDALRQDLKPKKTKVSER